MALTAEQLNILYARRREQEQQKIERTQELHRYYDHWGKVTSRYEILAGPEYYKEAEAKVSKVKEMREKQCQIEKRREKLKNLLEKEKLDYEEELAKAHKLKSRKITESTESLEKINQNIRQRDNIRRKLELEAKLYGKWRHGVDDENLIFESKSNHEVLAKLNWLDRQIEEKQKKEKEQAEAEERNLSMQKEMNKMAEIQKEREVLREKELQEIREIQDQHMQKLKELQKETEDLSAEEKMWRSSLKELDKERELLEESVGLLLGQNDEATANFNSRKVKIFMRQRSELVREAIKICLNILERLCQYSVQKERLLKLRQNYKDQIENETMMGPMIDAMYESEAKYSYQKSQETWKIAHTERVNEIKALLCDEENLVNMRLKENLLQQENIVQMRTAHINAIESSNDSLKKLIKERENEGNNLGAVKTVTIGSDDIIQKNEQKSHSSNNIPRVTSSFNNLNLDVWQNIDAPASRRRSACSSRSSLKDTESQCSFQVVTAENAERPKFARKRVAWN